MSGRPSGGYGVAMIQRIGLTGLVAAALSLGGCYSGIEFDSAGTLSGSTGGPGSTSGSEPTTGPAATSAPVGTEGDSADETGGPQTSGEPPATTGEATTMAGDETAGEATTGEPPPPPPPDPDVPDGVPYCDPAKDWDAGWRQLEEDVLAIVNQKRAQGADCGSEGNFGPAGPLTMDPALRCAARVHSKDMADRDFFDHDNPDGESPWDRMGKAGYGQYTNAGENIAAGSPTADGTMDQWMNSDGHCANIMNPDFEHIGVGYHPGGQYGHLWTQVFGAK